MARYLTASNYHASGALAGPPFGKAGDGAAAPLLTMRWRCGSPDHAGADRRI